ncbi:MAG TPA: threonine/serine dehydratase [Woeseiaceae bacterium]|nr:threonine/serine dehydratase [Woeseiaceae bacterium]
MIAKIPVPIPIEDIRAANTRIQGAAVRTPLIPFSNDASAAQIFLKPENLQEIGSFKIRGAYNALAVANEIDLADGVYTASAGNMAQGVAWTARRMNVQCEVIVPDHAPQTKLDAIRRLGGEIRKLPFDDWWQILIDHRCDGMKGKFVHPVSDRDVIAGNGTIGLEIIEDLPDVDTVIVPFGGGGLSCGIASAIKAIKPDTKVIAVEVDTACPLSAALKAGYPVKVDYKASFVDGIGSRGVLADMWPLSQTVLDGVIVVSLEEVAAAIRLLAERNRLIAEGAGAAAIAACLTGRAGQGNIVCIVSGGNIDTRKLGRILERKNPDT